MRSFFLSAAITLSLASMGCIRSYNVTPMSNASLQGAVTHPDGIELKTKAFMSPSEVAEKFGTKLAEDRQVIPVQVLITNKSTASYRVLRTSFVMEEQGQKVRLEALDPNQMYELGRHGYGAPVCGMIFGGVLGLPSLITTMNSNDRLREDYSRKNFMDTIIEPNKEAAGVVMFDPASRTLNRSGKYKLLVELENTVSKSKITVEQLFSQPKLEHEYFGTVVPFAPRIGVDALWIKEGLSLKGKRITYGSQETKVLRAGRQEKDLQRASDLAKLIPDSLMSQMRLSFQGLADWQLGGTGEVVLAFHHRMVKVNTLGSLDSSLRDWTANFPKRLVDLVR